MSIDEILGIIIDHTCTVIPSLKDHKFKKSDALKDIGANSIDRSEIAMMTMETLSLRIPLIEIAKAENIGDLASILHEKL